MAVTYGALKSALTDGNRICMYPSLDSKVTALVTWTSNTTSQADPYFYHSKIETAITEIKV